MPLEMPLRLESFVEASPEGSLRALVALSSAESLSDALAQRLVCLAGGDERNAARFVSALHISGFLVERNGSWHLAKQEREFLNGELLADSALFAKCHVALLKLASSEHQTEPAIDVPTYLTGPVGVAYHTAALKPESGLTLYRLTYGCGPGQQWLAARLAVEQRDQDILPRDAIEPNFLEGMALYREGRVRRALAALKMVAYSPKPRYEVAVAAHLFGRNIWSRDPREGTRLLLKSLRIGQQIGHLHHQAQVLHTLGQKLWASDRPKAERMLRRSLKILESTSDQDGQAQVLHTLGQKLWERDEQMAEKLLLRALKIREELVDRNGQAQVLHTLGQKIWERDQQRAEALLRRSLTLLETMNDRHGQAQVLHTLGQKLFRRDPTAAERLLQRSLEMLTAMRDRFGQAQVLHSLGHHWIESRPDEAERLLRTSLALGREIGNKRHQAIALLSLGKLLWKVDKKQGLELMRESLAIDRASGNKRGQASALHELQIRGFDSMSANEAEKFGV